MLIELLLFLALGISAGTLTGLIPGIHINLVGAFLISLSATIFFGVEPIYFAVFIVAMAITHTFLDFIPSVFLGCPDTDTELSVLPGHELLKNGQAHEAVTLTTYGSIAAILVTLIIFYPAILLIKQFYFLIQNAIPFILIIVSITLISLEKQKLTSLGVFILTGILGYVVLHTQINQPLLPLLTGIFGASSIILSLHQNPKIPEQIITKPKEKLLKPLLGATIAAPFCSFLPGMGSGQAAIIGNTIAKTTQKGFLILLGATNTLVMAFSFISLYVIERTRTGAALAIKEILGTPNEKTMILVLITIIIAGGISVFLTLNISKQIAKQFKKIHYKKLSVTTLCILALITLLVSGIYGLIVLIASTLTGIYCITLGVRRTNMMGVLIIPTIILYLL